MAKSSGFEDSGTPGLVKGASEKTIDIYKTEGFKHEGVSNSEGVDRFTENGASGITPDVMKMKPSPPVSKTVKDDVKAKGQGNGMPEDSGKVKNQPSVGNKTAGNVGSSNVSHK